jgi:hypothetical protein
MELRPDQLQDFAKLYHKKRFIHRGDPGTGKTPTICCLQKARWTEHGQGTVWPMPRKLMRKNYDEAMAWGGWNVGDVVLVNTQNDIIKNPNAKVFICGYDRFRLSWEKLPKHVRSIDIDEWHKGFGGHESKRTQALYEFCELRVRDDGWFVPMTGTAYNGSPDSVYPLLQIIVPTYYGTLKSFQNIHHIIDPFTGKILGYDGLEVLEDILTSISIVRRWADIHGPEEVVPQIVRVEMSDRQRVAYDKFKDEGLLELEQFFVDGTKPGVAFIRSRQLMEHPNFFPNLAGLAQFEISGAKFDQYVDVCPDELPGKLELFELDCERHLAAGTPFVAYSAMVPQQEQLLAVAQRVGLTAALLNGDTTQAEGERIDREFKAGRLQCIIASPIVADCGFNWQDWGNQEVNECIFVSLPYQDTAIAQAYKRFMRRTRLTALRIKLYAYIDSLDAHIMRLTKRKSVEAAVVEPGRQPLPY